VVAFPFSEFWWFYALFTLFVLAMLALDLGVFHRKAHEVSVKEATAWTVTWIALVALFNVLFYWYCLRQFGESPQGVEKARQLALEFLTGFVVEKSLAIDNIFVFAIVFTYFGIERIYQHRILFYGIIGALLFRALFIAVGAQLMAYHSVVIFFGVLLIFTGLKMLFSSSQVMDPERIWIMKLLRRVFRIDPKAKGDRFFIVKEGKRYITPLFLALVFIELTDILFAVDSVPAIFALTKEPLIVFTSNIFAILGLRSMYFMLSGVLAKFHYIKYGLAAVLVFVGLKMAWLNQLFDGKFPVTWSLAIILCLVLSSVGYSLLKSKKEA